ncbi:FadR family transcriptional regulator [Nocardioides sp. MJB4]|uniref:FadR family transcriptional regulator n=2 Tax=Nocardioides donggukensis TaxID=2774019 RepID=A0A927K721_9ACTN|nr:FadR family transcriptional regulator [Nocardioides donggukensis]
MERLVRSIRLGQFPPGSRLPSERDLAEELRVSRTTLREALAELKASSYVTVRRGRYGGSYVADALPHRPAAPLDADEVSDILTLRRILEPAAAELAAERGPTGPQREELWSLHVELTECSVGQYRPLDSRLHLRIAELSGTPSLLAAVADTRARVNSLLDRIPLLPTNLDHANAQHTEVVVAILDGDPAAARAAMLDHLDGTAALLRGFLG